VESGVNELVSRLVTVVDPRGVVREPPVDVFDNGDQLVILVDMPGLRRDSIRVRVGGNYVEVAAEPHAVPNGKPVRVERISNFRIYRRIEVGSRLRVDGAKAYYRDGVLHIVVSKLSGALESDISIEG